MSAPGVASATDGSGAGGAGDGIYGPGDVDEPPRPLSDSRPAFPSRALRMGLTAQVDLAFVIETDGNVTQVAAQCGSCDPMFLQAARQAAHGWRFVPARRQGQTVRVRVAHRIRFDLDE